MMRLSSLPSAFAPTYVKLEGALKRVIAHSHFMGRDITIELIRESLKDLLALQDKLVSVDNIQRTVAEYYKIKISDLLSKRRSRSVARPRQVAMALSKEPDQPQSAGNRRHVRWSRPYDRAARLPQDQRIEGIRRGHPRGLQEPAADADDLMAVCAAN